MRWPPGRAGPPQVGLSLNVPLCQKEDIRGLGQARCPTKRSRGCPRRVNRDIFVSKAGERDIPRLPFPRTFPLPTCPSRARTSIGRRCRVKNTRLYMAVYRGNQELPKRPSGRSGPAGTPAESSNWNSHAGGIRSYPNALAAGPDPPVDPPNLPIGTHTPGESGATPTAPPDLPVDSLNLPIGTHTPVRIRAPPPILASDL